MTNSSQRSQIKLYWITWGWLLVLTVVMIVLDYSSIYKWVIVALLLLGMLGKASLIVANFMHLRFERTALVLIVAIGILFTAVALFAGIVPDAVHIHNLSNR